MLLACWCLLFQVEHPNTDVEMQWRKAVSLQRKRAVMACFRMIPVYNISRSATIIFIFLVVVVVILAVGAAAAAAAVVAFFFLFV